MKVAQVAANHFRGSKMIPIMILDASFKIFKKAYNDIETCKKFDLKRLNYAAEEVDQFFADNGVYLSGCFNSKLWRIIYLFWYQVEIMGDS